jgi:bilirubin oxidase
MRKDRRDFLKLGALAAGGAMASSKWMSGALAPASVPLDPFSIPQFVSPLIVPPAMPRTAQLPIRGRRAADFYAIAVRQFQQQILPPGLPKTTVWGYGSVAHPGTFNYPSFTIEARSDQPVRVQWINQLVDSRLRFLPHLLPVDPTLHWANPGGPIDSRPDFRNTPGPYRGPVPIVTHVHGAHTTEESDGYPEAWFLPLASNIPNGFQRSGSFYDRFKRKFERQWLHPWLPGTSVFQYQNDQPATTLWYHDHTLGMTRLNVYAGPAGFFLIRGGNHDLPAGVLPGPAPTVGSDPLGRFYEIPIAIQDRAFNQDGSLFYPDSRLFFDGFPGPYIPNSDISPIFNPEFFGNTMVVNGRTWPVLDVEPRRYRFRFLNGCNSRFLILKLVTDPAATRPVNPALPFWQIGTEGGFLPQVVQLPQLLMALAERADVIVDFSEFKPGDELYLINEGPDEPFGGGEPATDFEPSNPMTTGVVMKLRVVPLASIDTSVHPASLTLPAATPLGAAVKTRQLTLNEEGSAVLPGVGPRAALLGTLDAAGNPAAMMWSDPITENPRAGDTELWELYNFTADAHPIHLHQVQFQVVDRQPLAADGEGISTPPATFAGPPLPPEEWETGFKDTVISYPGQVARIKARFDIPGRFVWHCHIVEHEDNEMMRPYQVEP